MFYPAKKDTKKVSKRIEFPKNCSGTSNNKLWWCPANFGDAKHSAKQYMQLQNNFLNYKHQLKSFIPEATIPTQHQESNQISTNLLTGEAATAPNPVQEPPEIIPATPVQEPTQVTAPEALSTMANTSSISLPSLLQFWHPLPQWNRCLQLESVNASSLSNL